MKIKNFIIPIFITGVLFGLGGASQASAEPQDSVITDVTTAGCSTTSEYVVSVDGIFLSPITSILVNGKNIESSRWAQSQFNIDITMPASNAKSVTMDLLNGLTPTLGKQILYCNGSVVTPTETGGTLPSTSTNNYNFLVAGAGLVVLGTSGLLFRRRTQN